jgi:hypothetical protein
MPKPSDQVQFIIFIEIGSNCEPRWFGKKMYENPNCDLIVRHAQICHNHQTCKGHNNTMKKVGVLQLALQLIVYMVQLITIQLKLCWNNSFSTTMQSITTTTITYANVTNLHPSIKFDTWNYEDFWI